LSPFSCPDLFFDPLPRDRPSTISSIKRRNSTRSDWSRFVFIIRKTFNQRSLWYRAAPQSLGDCIAWYGLQTILVFNCGCCHQPLVHLKF
jgi:hypothetical protein